VASPAHIDRPSGPLQAGLDFGRYPVTLGLAALTCALTPAYTVRWRVAFYPTTLLEIALLATVAAFAFEAWRLHERPTWRSPLTIPACIFLVAGAISVLAAPDKRAALGI